MDKKDLRKAKNSAKKCLECTRRFTKHQVKVPVHQFNDGKLELKGFACACCIIVNDEKYGVVELE